MSMIENAAQAVYEHWQFGHRDPESKPAWVPRGNSLRQQEARDYARAVLESLLEPSPEVLRAGTMALGDLAPVVLGVWRRMMRAALGEETQGTASPEARESAPADTPPPTTLHTYYVTVVTPTGRSVYTFDGVGHVRLRGDSVVLTDGPPDPRLDQSAPSGVIAVFRAPESVIRRPPAPAPSPPASSAASSSDV